MCGHEFRRCLTEGRAGPRRGSASYALIDGTLVLAPASVAELLSDPGITPPIEESVLDIPQLEVTSGYWERVGRLRARLMRHRYRPKPTDSLIAQSCLDHHVLLVTRDRDFSPFKS